MIDVTFPAMSLPMAAIILIQPPPSASGWWRILQAAALVVSTSGLLGHAIFDFKILAPISPGADFALEMLATLALLAATLTSIVRRYRERDAQILAKGA